MNPHSTLYRKRGFTLLETILASGILLVTMVGTLSMLSLSWGTMARTQEQIYVNRILESRIEEIRDLSFDELEALPSTTSFPVLPATSAFGNPINPDVYYTQYEYERYLHGVQGMVYLQPLGANLMKVIVTVSWMPAGEERDMSMNTVTYIGRNGVNRL